MVDVKGRCPACGSETLFVGDGGYLTCSRIDCPHPDAASQILAEFWQARQHSAYTFCAQNVGHVTTEAYAKKITEKLLAEKRAQRLQASINALQNKETTT
jgi:hypothetical protein